MPVYGSAPPATADGRGAMVWNNETLTLPSAGASLSVSMHRNSNLPNCVSAEIAFGADPGAFAIDLQVADTDQEKFFVTKATLNSGLNTSFVARIEATNIVAKFARLRMVTRTNSVPVTAKLY